MTGSHNHQQHMRFKLKLRLFSERRSTVTDSVRRQSGDLEHLRINHHLQPTLGTTATLAKRFSHYSCPPRNEPQTSLGPPRRLKLSWQSSCRRTSCPGRLSRQCKHGEQRALNVRAEALHDAQLSTTLLRPRVLGAFRRGSNHYRTSKH